MRRILGSTLLVVTLLTAVPTCAQNPNYAVKKEGMITDYKVWTNVTTDGPGDCDVAIGLLYSHYTAFDAIEVKAATISTKHCGSRVAMIEAGKKRNDIRELVSSKLAREVMPKWQLSKPKTQTGRAPNTRFDKHSGLAATEKPHGSYT